MKGFDIMFSSEIKKEIAFEMYDSFKNYESIQDMYLCDISNEFYNNVILSNNEASLLINDIREDFKENQRWGNL